MRKRYLFGLLAALAAGLGPGAPAEQTGSAFTEAEADALVREHNGARDKVGVKQHVTWSKDLAKYAQEWADHIAQTGKFEHRRQPKYGESLAAGPAERYGAAEAAAAWLREKGAYDAGKREPGKVGHYTQVVWSRTTRIGAGKAVLKAGPMKGWTVVVCNYDPRGNVRGQRPYPEGPEPGLASRTPFRLSSGWRDHVTEGRRPGLVGADEESTRPPNSSRSSHHDEPGFRTALGERQILEIRPDLEP